MVMFSWLKLRSCGYSAVACMWLMLNNVMLQDHQLALNWAHTQQNVTATEPSQLYSRNKGGVWRDDS